MVELPFLSLRDPSVLAQELKHLAEMASASDLDSEALKQFGKALRNARFSGANNRFYRGASGSVENLVLNLVATIYQKTKKVVFPQFVPRISLDHQATKPPFELPLISMDRFLSVHTNNGTLYHGTDSIDNALAILRGGLIMSGGVFEQGTFAEGEGGYTSKNLNVAQQYAGNKGMVLQLTPARDSRLKILDYNSVTTETHASISQLCIERGITRNELLRNVFGIHIVIDEHVKLLSLAAVNLATDVQ